MSLIDRLAAIDHSSCDVCKEAAFSATTQRFQPRGDGGRARSYPGLPRLRSQLRRKLNQDRPRPLPWWVLYGDDVPEADR